MLVHGPPTLAALFAPDGRKLARGRDALAAQLGGLLDRQRPVAGQQAGLEVGVPQLGEVRRLLDLAELLGHLPLGDGEDRGVVAGGGGSRRGAEGGDHRGQQGDCGESGEAGRTADHGDPHARAASLRGDGCHLTTTSYQGVILRLRPELRKRRIFCRAAVTRPSRSGHRHLDRVPAGRPGRERHLLPARLGHPVGVGRPHLEDVAARRGRPTPTPTAARCPPTAPRPAAPAPSRRRRPAPRPSRCPGAAPRPPRPPRPARPRGR